MASTYTRFLRREPRARAYLVGSLIDDLGVAVSGWAATLMMTRLAVNQEARASAMLPTLVCFLVGALVSGPLADRTARTSLFELARWRWKVVMIGRLGETAMLGYLVVAHVAREPTIASVLPYMMVAAFMKTALRATRVAFSVDLLDDEVESRAENGELLRDERGAPLRYKTHLVTFSSLVSLVSTVALLIGLIAGGEAMERVGGRLYVLFAFDVITNLGFVAVLYFFCRPAAPAAEVIAAEQHAPLPRPEGAWKTFAAGFRFLAQPAQRPLLALLAGSWLVEVITESYDGKMVIKHVLHASDDGLRYAELAWTLVAAVGAALLPLLARRVGSLGRIFVVCMLLDGFFIAAAGQFATIRAVGALLPFSAVLCVDQSLTLAATTLSDVAQNSVSSAAMRGRIAANYALVVIVGDMLSESLAVAAEQRWGIPGLILRAGLLQVGLVALIAVAGGRKLWHFGLRVNEPAPLHATGLGRGEAPARVHN